MEDYTNDMPESEGSMLTEDNKSQVSEGSLDFTIQKLGSQKVETPIGDDGELEEMIFNSDSSKYENDEDNYNDVFNEISFKENNNGNNNRGRNVSNDNEMALNLDLNEEFIDQVDTGNLRRLDTTELEGSFGDLNLNKSNRFLKDSVNGLESSFREEFTFNQQNSSKYNNIIQNNDNNEDSDELKEDIQIVNKWLFNVATKQFGLLISSDVVRYITEWLKVNKMLSRDEESRSAKTLGSLCEKYRATHGNFDFTSCLFI